MKKAKDIIYVGVDDTTLDLFEGQYVVPEGMSYNSYVIMDEKVAVMDAVDKAKIAEWLGNVEDALAGRQPDYLVISHMEPDHSAGVAAFAAKYPEVTVVGNAKIFDMFQGAVLGGRFRQIRRSLQRDGRLGLRGEEILLQHRRKIRRAGAGAS